MAKAKNNELRPVLWDDERLRLLDQRKLPEREEYLWLDTADDVAEAIEKMIVRGAPAIGIAAVYGVVLATKGFYGSPAEFISERLPLILDRLRRTRPTAVNLFWALNRMERVAISSLNSPLVAIAEKLLSEADKIMNENLEECKAIGKHGSKLLPKTANVMTICNAGALATAGYGTALGVIRSAVAEKKNIHVYALETRPVLQGSRLTSWELMRDGIPVTLITDGMAAFLMSQKKISAVVIGADRIAANGDSANKIGSMSLAIIARYFKVPFYVAAPFSTCDFAMKSGKGIHIEFRSPDEVKQIGSYSSAPKEVDVWNPAFDVVPAHLISAIITEAGVAEPPFDSSLTWLRDSNATTAVKKSTEPKE